MKKKKNGWLRKLQHVPQEKPQKLLNAQQGKQLLPKHRPGLRLKHVPRLKHRPGLRHSSLLQTAVTPVLLLPEAVPAVLPAAQAALLEAVPAAAQVHRLLRQSARPVQPEAMSSITQHSLLEILMSGAVQA